MGKCIIFCAAEFDGLLAPISPEDHVIAADGGLKHTEALGIRPRDILGDFDSLGYTPNNARLFPVEKDDTDSLLSIRLGLDLGYREFLLYGAVDGPRLDHTIANFQALQFLCDRGCWGYLVGRDYLITVVQRGSLIFPGCPRGTVSVFCLGPDAQGVTLEGLHYPLTEGTLKSGFPLGISNHFTEKPAKITVKDGSLLVLWPREAGLPQREEG